nr:MAG TPA: hypothetical protein [Caudoviricetes sp.]
MFEKFKTLVLPTFENGWKEVYPEDGSTCAIILDGSNTVVADVVFCKDVGLFEGYDIVYFTRHVSKFYQYED